jgi:hypothetical protein
MNPLLMASDRRCDGIAGPAQSRSNLAIFHRRSITPAEERD